MSTYQELQLLNQIGAQAQSGTRVNMALIEQRRQEEERKIGGIFQGAFHEILLSPGSAEEKRQKVLQLTGAYKNYSINRGQLYDQYVASGNEELLMSPTERRYRTAQADYYTSRASGEATGTPKLVSWTAKDGTEHRRYVPLNQVNDFYASIEASGGSPKLLSERGEGEAIVANRYQSAYNATFHSLTGLPKEDVNPNMPEEEKAAIRAQRKWALEGLERERNKSTGGTTGATTGAPLGRGSDLSGITVDQLPKVKAKTKDVDPLVDNKELATLSQNIFVDLKGRLGRNPSIKELADELEKAYKAAGGK